MDPKSLVQPAFSAAGRGRGKAERQLSANQGTPRSLAHELGEAGYAAVEEYLKLSRGVGVPTLGPDGAFVMSSAENAHLLTTLCMGGELVSLACEQALRHRLPTMLNHFAHVASEHKLAFDEYERRHPAAQATARGQGNDGGWSVTNTLEVERQLSAGESTGLHLGAGASVSEH